jgi:ATP-dependent Lon protease
MKYSTSASELTFFAAQLLTSASKDDLQAVLDENNLEQRVEKVLALMIKEVEQKRVTKDKREH